MKGQGKPAQEAYLDLARKSLAFFTAIAARYDVQYVIKAASPPLSSLSCTLRCALPTLPSPPPRFPARARKKALPPRNASSLHLARHERLVIVPSCHASFRVSSSCAGWGRVLHTGSGT